MLYTIVTVLPALLFLAAAVVAFVVMRRTHRRAPWAALGGLALLLGARHLLQALRGAPAPGAAPGPSELLLLGASGLVVGALLLAAVSSVAGQERALARARAAGLASAARLRKVERDKGRTEASFRELLEAAPDAMILVDREGRVALANARAEEMFGRRRNEILGKAVELLLPERFREAHRAHRKAYFAAPVTRPMGVGLELKGLRADGTEFPVEVALSPLEWGGEPHVVASIRDIGERKRMEEQLFRSQKLEAVGRLAGGVAHDFNNMLTAILGTVDLILAETPAASPLREDLEEIREAARRAAGLTRQLLAFSRRQVLHPQVVNLNEVVAGIEPMLRRLIGEDVDFVTHLDPALGRVMADPAQIEQVILNLALNARDAMPRGGRLTLETGNAELGEEYARTHAEVTPGAYVMLAVSDTGEGMDPETLAHVFEPFFTTKSEGTGLGLATVYGIVKQSGGHIWTYSEPGRGTTFKIYLPRVTEAAGEPVPEEAAPAPAGGRETILLVEDERAVRRLAARILDREGYTVVEAASAREALALLEEHRWPVDLLLTDVVLPDMSGETLARRVRAAVPGIRVLYMSGYTDNAIVHHGVLEPGVEFLEKPFTPAVLAGKVRQVLDRPPPGAEG